MPSHHLLTLKYAFFDLPARAVVIHSAPMFQPFVAGHDWGVVCLLGLLVCLSIAKEKFPFPCGLSRSLLAVHIWQLKLEV